MSYTHTKQGPVVLKNDPVDPDGTDWVYFSYGTWLRTGESIVSHLALISGGSIVTDSIYLGNMQDSEGTLFTEVYGVEFSVTTGATKVTITHRKTTTTTGSVDLGRTNIDHSAILMVKSL